MLATTARAASPTHCTATNTSSPNNSMVATTCAPGISKNYSQSGATDHSRLLKTADANIQPGADPGRPPASKRAMTRCSQGTRAWRDVHNTAHHASANKGALAASATVAAQITATPTRNGKVARVVTMVWRNVRGSGAGKWRVKWDAMDFTAAA
jgi:hypothetical protein